MTEGSMLSDHKGLLGRGQSGSLINLDHNSFQ